MKKLLIILISIFSFAGVAFALPYYSSTQTMIPFVDNSYDIGTSSKAYRNLYVNSFNLSGTAINSILSTDVNGNIVATSTPTFGYFNATSTTATSTIAGNVKVSGNLEVTGVSLLSIVSSGAFTSTGLITGTSFTATSNTASVFPYASTTVLSASGSLISPFLTGGSGTTQDLTFQTTSGVGATGADMHFLVGNNGATEAMTILNSGFVGFGTNAPIALVDIRKTGTGVQDGLYLVNAQAAAAGVGEEISFSGSAVRQATIQGAWTGAATTDGYLAFITRKSNTLTEQMRILAGGNVGIGTTTPGATLSFGTSPTIDSTTSIIEQIGATTVGTWSANGLALSKTSGNLTLSNITTTSGESWVNFSGYQTDTNPPSQSGGTQISLRNLDTTSGNFTTIIGKDAGGQGTSAIGFVNVVDADNSGAMVFSTSPSGGVLIRRFEVDKDGNFIFNETGTDSDFRVESDNNTHALFVQGSDGNVGIGTSTPT